MRFLLPSLLIACTSLAAQNGGFVAGDVWHSSDGIQFLPHTGGSLQRIDPLSGGVTPMVGSDLSSGLGSLAYDTYRQRLIWRSTIDPTPPLAQYIWQVDGAGTLTDMELALTGYRWFAPTGDGRIYCHDSQVSNQLAWIDAANRVHVLQNQAGTGPFIFAGGPIATTRGAVYDPVTNALFYCSHLDCSGLASQKIVIAKLPLSADGTRVAGPLECNSFEVSNSGEGPTGLARMPNGQLLITMIATDAVPNVPLPRLLTADPVTLAMSPFATIGIANQPLGFIMDHGIWSSRLNKALVIDTFGNKLRAWSQGEVGNGSVISPVGGIFSPAFSSAEQLQLAEIPDTVCDGAWVPYGKGLAGTGGKVPGLFGEGCAAPGEIVFLHIDEVLGGASGVLFVALAPAAVPFKGGTFHLAGFVLSVDLTLGGSGTAALPAAMPAFPGLSLFLQAAFSDPGAVKDVSLTQGLELAIG